jgi:hypothetical protein
MLRGVPESSEARVSTLDITDLNPVLHRTPGLTKLTGDANRKKIIQQGARHFACRSDLHRHQPFVSGDRLDAWSLRYAVATSFYYMDGINLNNDMVAIWSRLREIYPETIHCVEIVLYIRSVKCGFGLIEFDV